MITTELEKTIDRLIAKHGYQTVRDHCDELLKVKGAKLPDWLSICNYIDRVGRRQKSKARNTPH